MQCTPILTLMLSFPAPPRTYSSAFAFACGFSSKRFSFPRKLAAFSSTSLIQIRYPSFLRQPSSHLFLCHVDQSAKVAPVIAIKLISNYPAFFHALQFIANKSLYFLGRISGRVSNHRSFNLHY